ncbi:MAG: hypothetical protein WAN20_12530, partial [Pseudonocardiaceae bacterium]
LISAELGRPVAIDTDPKAAIALGAALCALPTPTTDTAPEAPIDRVAVPETSAPAAGSELPSFTPAEVPQRPSLTALPLDVEPATLQWRKARSRRAKHVALAGALALFTVAGAASVPFLTSRTGPLPPADAGTSTPSTPAAPGAPAPGAPAPAASSAPNAETSSDNSSNSEGSGGPVRTTPRAAPNKPAGAVARHDPPAGAPSAPPPSWVTTYTWTSTWSSPPPTTTTTVPPPPPPTKTTKAPPPPTTTTAVPTTTAHRQHGQPG